MTGPLQALIASAGGNFPKFVPDTALIVISENPVSAATTTINFVTDGSVTRSTTTAFGTNTGFTQYMRDVVAGAGNNVWIRVTITGGTFTTSAGAGWLQLNTTRTWTKNVVSGISQGVDFTVELSLDGGSSVILTKTGNFIGASPV